MNDEHKPNTPPQSGGDLVHEFQAGQNTSQTHESQPANQEQRAEQLVARMQSGEFQELRRLGSELGIIDSASNPAANPLLPLPETQKRAARVPMQIGLDSSGHINTLLLHTDLVDPARVLEHLSWPPHLKSLTLVAVSPPLLEQMARKLPATLEFLSLTSPITENAFTTLDQLQSLNLSQLKRFDLTHTPLGKDPVTLDLLRFRYPLLDILPHSAAQQDRAQALGVETSRVDQEVEKAIKQHNKQLLEAVDIECQRVYTAGEELVNAFFVAITRLAELFPSDELFVARVQAVYKTYLQRLPSIQFFVDEATLPGAPFMLADTKARDTAHEYLEDARGHAERLLTKLLSRATTDTARFRAGLISLQEQAVETKNGEPDTIGEDTVQDAQQPQEGTGDASSPELTKDVHEFLNSPATKQAGITLESTSLETIKELAADRARLTDKVAQVITMASQLAAQAPTGTSKQRILKSVVTQFQQMASELVNGTTEPAAEESL